MTLQPARGYLLIKLVKDDQGVSPGGFVAPESVTEHEKPAKGEVLAVGAPPVFYGSQEPHYPNWEVKVGDTVVVKRWGGQDVKEGGQELKLVHFSELMGVFR